MSQKVKQAAWTVNRAKRGGANIQVDSCRHGV
jgi:hypothetical protein